MITLDNAPATRQLASNATSLTYQFTRASGPGAILVAVLSTNAVTPSSVTFGGQALSLLGSTVLGTNDTVGLWWLVNPTASGSATVLITGSGTATYLLSTAMSFSGAVGSTPNLNTANASNVTTLPNNLTVGDQSVIVLAGASAGGDASPGTNLTTTTSSNPLIGYYGPRSGAGSSTLSITKGSADQLASIVCELAPAPAGVVIPATDSRLVTYGDGTTINGEKVTIKSGYGGPIAFACDSATLNFDVANLSVYPDVVTVVDGEAPVRTSLSSTINSVTISPTYTSQTAVKALAHQGRWFFTGIFEGQGANSAGTPQTVDQWNNQLAAGKFVGVTLPAGGTLLAPPINPDQIEFCGDSITASVRNLYTGTASDQTVMASHRSWPVRVADLLGFAPVIRGLGGTGITTGGSGGAPAFAANFPYAFAGHPYTPAIPPKIVVLYLGTNDGPNLTAAGYLQALQAVRAARPAAILYAVVPNAVSATPIQTAVTQFADANTTFLNYSTGVLVAADLSDGIHPNPGGTSKLAVRLATDIQADLVTRGFAFQGSTTTTAATLSLTLAAGTINQAGSATVTLLGGIAPTTSTTVNLAYTGATGPATATIAAGALQATIAVTPTAASYTVAATGAGLTGTGSVAGTATVASGGALTPEQIAAILAIPNLVTEVSQLISTAGLTLPSGVVVGVPTTTTFSTTGTNPAGLINYGQGQAILFQTGQLQGLRRVILASSYTPPVGNLPGNTSYIVAGWPVAPAAGDTFVIG